MKENLNCEYEDNSCNREKMGCEGCKYSYNIEIAFKELVDKYYNKQEKRR